MREAPVCSVDERDLWEWVEDETPLDGVDLEHHLSECDVCAGRVAQMRRLMTGIEELTRAGPSPAPERVGAYAIVRQVGEGGMGVVYEAVQESTRQRVALKLLHQARAFGDTRARGLAREARILARLHHPGIARILDAGAHADGRPYIVVEFVEGRSIDRYAEDRGLSIGDRARLVSRIAHAVHHAHQRGVLHCDLKPANVLVDANGAPRVVDFGLARPAIAELDWALSMSHGDVAGTLPFMSPEQARGDADEIDVRTDVYGLGAVAYALLTGRPPHEGNGGEAERGNGNGNGLRRDAPPPHPSSIDARIPRELGDVVAESLHPDPDERYGSAEAFAEDLERFLDGRVVLAREASALYRLRVLLRRNKAPCAALALVFLALTSAVVLTRRSQREAERQRDQVGATLALMTEALRDGGRREDFDGGAIVPSKSLQSVEQQLAAGTLFDDDSLVGARVRAEIGRIYRQMSWDAGDAAHEASALSHTRAALETRRRRLGEDHPETVESLFDLSLVLRDREEARRILESIERRHRAGKVPPCLGVARSLLELSDRGSPERREALASAARELLEALDAPPVERLEGTKRWAQVAYESGELLEAEHRAAEFKAERARLGIDDGLDFARLTFGSTGRIRVGGSAGGELFDDEDPGRATGGSHVRVGDLTVCAQSTWSGPLNCGSDQYFVIDLRPRPEDPAPLATAPDLDAAYEGGLFAPPLARDPLVDHVHANLRLWRVFDEDRERVHLDLTLRYATTNCAWRQTGDALVFTEPLFIRRTPDPDVCIVTTRDPEGAGEPVDRLDLVRRGATIATYRVPLELRVERVAAERR